MTLNSRKNPEPFVLSGWIQGVDLYGALDNRLLKGFEYTAKYNLGNDVPYEPYGSFEGRYYYEELTGKSRGRLRPMYQKVYNHYHNRQQLEAPFTKQAVGKERSRRRKRVETYIDLLIYTK